MKNVYYCSSFIFTLLFSSYSFGQKFMTGLSFDDGSSKGMDMYESDAFGFGDELPDSTTLRMYAPYPGNQGSYGTCVGWSFGYCGMTTLYARQFGIKNRNIITAMALCPYSVYNNIKAEDDIGCSGGSNLVNAGEFLTKTGTKRFHLRDSDCGTTDEVDEGLMIYKADSYAPLWEWGYGDEEELDKTEKTKSALADGNIVLIGMGVGTSFCEGVNEHGEWIKSDDPWENMPTGGHAMCVLGYNDNRFGGTFEIQNSWGQDWGDGGYVYVTYADYQEYVQRAVVMELDEENKWKDMASKKGCLFGDCSGEYSRFTFENGDTYEGLIKNGMPDGNGIYQWNDGDLYAGEFKAGLKEGVGTYFYADGSTQKGHWKEDAYRADLAYLDYNYGTVDLGEAYWQGYSNGKNWIYGGYFFSHGEKVYEGKFTDGNPDDFGLLHRYGQHTLSEFKEGAYHGFNVVFDYDESWTVNICEDDDCDIAQSDMISLTVEELPKGLEAKDDTLVGSTGKCTFGDCQNGFTRFTYASGNNYEGFLVNGWRHGYGIYTYANDSKIASFEGEYRFGERNGIGRLIMKDGGRFIGEFKHGKPEGMGMWIKADGKVQAGKWENGEYVEADQGFGFADSEPLKTDAKSKEGLDPAAEKAPKKFAKPVQLK